MSAGDRGSRMNGRRGLRSCTPAAVVALVCAALYVAGGLFVAVMGTFGGLFLGAIGFAGLGVFGLVGAALGALVAATGVRGIGGCVRDEPDAWLWIAVPAAVIGTVTGLLAPQTGWGWTAFSVPAVCLAAAVTAPLLRRRGESSAQAAADLGGPPGRDGTGVHGE